jgi:hypothetical protein
MGARIDLRVRNDRPARDSDAAGKGELCALYVDPEWWGRVADGQRRTEEVWGVVVDEVRLRRSLP